MEGSIHWKRIVLSAVITALVTILSGTILFRLQIREPKLVYQVVESIPFEGTYQNMAIYHLSILNVGAKSVTNLRSLVRIPQATLLDIRLVIEPTLPHSYGINGDTLELHVDELAQCEGISVSLLAEGQARLPSAPQVFVRGEGVTGVMRPFWKRRAILDLLRRLLAGTCAESRPAQSSIRFLWAGIRSDKIARGQRVEVCMSVTSPMASGA